MTCRDSAARDGDFSARGLFALSLRYGQYVIVCLSLRDGVAHACMFQPPTFLRNPPRGVRLLFCVIAGAPRDGGCYPSPSIREGTCPPPPRRRPPRGRWQVCRQGQADPPPKPWLPQCVRHWERGEIFRSHLLLFGRRPFSADLSPVHGLRPPRHLVAFAWRKGRRPCSGCLPRPLLGKDPGGWIGFPRTRPRDDAAPGRTNRRRSAVERDHTLAEQIGGSRGDGDVKERHGVVARRYDKRSGSF